MYTFYISINNASDLQKYFVKIQNKYFHMKIFDILGIIFYIRRLKGIDHFLNSFVICCLSQQVSTWKWLSLIRHISSVYIPFCLCVYVGECVCWNADFFTLLLLFWSYGWFWCRGATAIKYWVISQWRGRKYFERNLCYSCMTNSWETTNIIIEKRQLRF